MRHTLDYLYYPIVPFSIPQIAFHSNCVVQSCFMREGSYFLQRIGHDETWFLQEARFLQEVALKSLREVSCNVGEKSHRNT